MLIGKILLLRPFSFIGWRRRKQRRGTTIPYWTCMSLTLEVCNQLQHGWNCGLNYSTPQVTALLETSFCAYTLFCTPIFVTYFCKINTTRYQIFCYRILVSTYLCDIRACSLNLSVPFFLLQVLYILYRSLLFVLCFQLSFLSLLVFIYLFASIIFYFLISNAK